MRGILARTPAIVASGSILTSHILALKLPTETVTKILLLELGGLFAVGLVQIFLQQQRHRTALELFRTADGPVSIVIHADGGIEMRPQGGSILSTSCSRWTWL